MVLTLHENHENCYPTKIKPSTVLCEPKRVDQPPIQPHPDKNKLKKKPVYFFKTVPLSMYHGVSNVTCEMVQNDLCCHYIVFIWNSIGYLILLDIC